ncbi:hypothetical protein AAHH67_12935 [Niallia circulans]
MEQSTYIKLKRLTNYINGMRNDQKGVRGSVVIIKDTDIISSKGFGYA